MEKTVDTSRRGVLRWGALAIGALAGTAGVAAAVERSASFAAGRPGKPRTLQLDGRAWRLQVQGKRRGERLDPGDRAAVFGELMSGGRKVGEFYSTSVFVGAPMGLSPHAATYVESHHFNLEGGTLLGSGTSRPLGAAEFSVVGGTGRYAGASGTYAAVQNPIETGGDGTARFTFNLVLQEA